ncbi:MAG: polysulfide reductase NrfD [Deltaproteobacteria bacterium]|nr:polysulfide reductase NrfD [Deltaproteobacteria bacterium]
MADRDAFTYFRPLIHTSWGSLALLALSAAGAAWYFFGAFYLQFFHGHQLTGQGTHGAMWGSMVANIVQLIGVSHVGIAISATVRILKLRRYQQLARVAELVTLVSLTAAVCNIAGDVGRPDRFLTNVIKNGNYTGPFVWSASVITNYLVGSCVYLYLAMRRDIYLCSCVLPRRRWLYRILSLGYTDTPEERENHERTVWWCAVIILPIMVSVHSVYGWVFGLNSGRPGWFNPFQAPYFVLGAIVTGFSGVIVITALVRRVYKWEEFFPNRMFKGLGIFLGFVTLLYLYFLFSEVLTGVYTAPEAERGVLHDLLFGRFATIAWAATVGGMVVPFFILFVQGANPRICSMRVVVAAALPIFIAMWCWRYLITVPSFFHSHVPYRLAEYAPTLFDWSLVVATYSFGVFFYLSLVKLLPVLEIPEKFKPACPARPPRITLGERRRWGALKRVSIGATLATGAGLIAAGIASRHRVEIPAPAIWISGIVCLWTIPLQACLLPGFPSAGRVRAHMARMEPGLLRAPRPAATAVGLTECAASPATIEYWIDEQFGASRGIRRRPEIRGIG